MMADAEWKKQIFEDIEVLKEDIAEYVKACKPNRYDQYTPSMVCPKCGSTENNSIATQTEGGCRLRRRKCLVCDARWNTIEIGSISGPSTRAAGRKQ